MAYIGIDIGHGIDTFPPSKGVYNKGKGYAEHDFNSRLGIELKEVLESNGHKVIFGQQPFKRDVPLRTRTNLYNQKKVDLVISLHANYNSNPSASGRCVFYWGTSGKSKALAESVRDEIGATGYSLHGNGLHAGVEGSWTNLHINRKTNMPAILVEHGFMGNSSDFESIFGRNKVKYIKDMAKADAKGIQAWLGERFESGTVGGISKPSPVKADAHLSYNQVVDKTIAGGYGSQPDRAKNIINRTEFTYLEVQNGVNKKLVGKTLAPKRLSFAEVVRRTASGEYGNMPERKKKVEAIGHNYDEVQKAVNKGKVSKPNRKSAAVIADEIYRGKGNWGTGNTRTQRLKKAGHNPKQVQALVNKKFR